MFKADVVATYRAERVAPRREASGRKLRGLPHSRGSGLEAAVLARALTRALALGAVLLLLASCSTEEYADRATLLRDPAAKLCCPEAVELGHVGGERAHTFEGPRGAFDGYILGTQAGEREVHDYYARELARLGWLPDRLVGTRATTELAAYGWPLSRGRVGR